MKRRLLLECLPGDHIRIETPSRTLSGLVFEVKEVYVYCEVLGHPELSRYFPAHKSCSIIKDGDLRKKISLRSLRKGRK